MTEPVFEVASTRSLGEGVFIRLEEIRLRSSSGEEVVRDVVRHPGGVAVLPVDGDHVWLIRQHRVALGRYIDEIPAGKLDVDGEATADAARRELIEELGATPRRLSHLATMAPSPGYTDEVIEIYVAEGLDFGDRSPQGAEEADSSIHSLPIADALDSISNGGLTDAKTLVALLEWNRRTR
ncbi:MAG TPA: NUDIX hydrolase [Acidimicrobiia bacterium]|nr:NUDIX hydrolase [Acidimicrobiia bacterium]